MRDQLFDYVNGHLNDAEETSFEDAMSKDKELALEVEEFRLQQELMRGALDLEFVPAARNWKPVFALAGIVLVLIGIFWARPKEQTLASPVILQTEDPKIQVVLVPQIPIMIWDGGGPS